MKNQNLLNRLNTLEQNNKDLIQTKQFETFIKSLPAKDQKKFRSTKGVIIFRGESEDFYKIIKLYKGDLSNKRVIIDNIPRS